MKKIYLLFLTLWLFKGSIFAQTDTLQKNYIDIIAGIGAPEALYGGLRIQFPQTQMGFSVGSIPHPEDKLISVSADLYIHFGKVGKFGKRKRNYLKLGGNYSREESITSIYKKWYFCPRLGREYMIRRNFGFNFEGGLAVLLSNKEIEKIPPKWNFGLDMTIPVLPAITIGVFYRI